MIEALKKWPVFAILFLTTTLFFNNCGEFQTSQDLFEAESNSSITDGQTIDEVVDQSNLFAFFDMNLVSKLLQNEVNDQKNMATSDVNVEAKEFGNELILNGTSSYAELSGLNFFPKNTNTLSIGLIARSSSNASGWAQLLAIGTPGSSKVLYISRNGSNLRVGNDQYIEVPNLYSGEYLNRYSYISVVYNNNTLALFVDGAKQGELTNFTLDLSGGKILLGKQVNKTDEYWAGGLAKLRFYSKPLSGLEVGTLYQADFASKTSQEPIEDPNPLPAPVDMAVDGGWTDWMNSTQCSVKCGGGVLVESRSCSNPVPQNGGKICEGSSIREVACNTAMCEEPPKEVPTPIDGGWTIWKDASMCSKDCGGGVLTQNRTCTNPTPQNGGAICSGDATREIACNTQTCPAPTPTPPPIANYGEGGTVELDHLVKEFEQGKLDQLLQKFSISHRVIKSGNWSDTAIWEGGRIPGANAVVFIGSNYKVNYDLDSVVRLKFVRNEGELNFSTSKSTRMVVDTLVSTIGSAFSIGSLGDAVSSNVTSEVIIADNGPVDYNVDSHQLGRGLVLQGKVSFHGAKKSPYLAADLPASGGQKVLDAGAVTIKVKGDASGWKVGDTVLVMGTANGKYQDETRVIKQVNGNSIVLDKALSYKHDTPKFQTSNISGISELNIYIGNLTRNVVVRSEYTGLSEVRRRGHVMIMFADGADVRFSEFRDLGRTDKRSIVNDHNNPGVANLEGRYPLYFHHTGVKGSRVPFKAIGNAVHGSPSWGLVHQDGYGAVNYNVVYNCIGAGIVSEDGNEAGEWVGNFVTNIPGASGRSKVNQITVQAVARIGFAGIAYEGQSRVINFRKNIAANSRIGWSFLGAQGSLNHIKSLPDNDPNQPYFKNPLIVTTRDPNPLFTQFDDRPGWYDGPMSPPFVNFEHNETIAVSIGVNSWHRHRSPKFETLNNIHYHVGWRNSEVFNFVNYHGGYHISRSLFVGNGAVLKAQSKTMKNSLVRNHIESSTYSYSSDGISLNHMGYFYNNTEVNVENPLSSNYFPAQKYGGKSLGQINQGSLVEFTVPYLNISQPGTSIKKIDYPQIKLDFSPEVGPSSRGIGMVGTATDSFGTRDLHTALRIDTLQHFGPDELYNTNDDIKTWVDEKPGLFRKQHGYQPFIPPSNEFEAYTDSNTYDWELVLKEYGVYKTGGKWVMPVPFWINDNLDGLPYPIIVNHDVKGASEAQLQEYSLDGPPQVDLVNTYYGNPNVNTDGSFRRTRVYYQKSWRVPIDEPYEL